MYPMLRDYPHLPLLSFEQSMSVFTHAKISFNMLAELLGYSRQSVYLWRKGRSPHPLAQDRVSTLAFKALACLRARTLPAGKRAKRAVVQALLDGVNLDQYKPADLLPPAWMPTIE